jgi:hypothetical protein
MKPTFKVWILLLLILLLHSCAAPVIDAWIQTPIHPLGGGDITFQFQAHGSTRITGATLTIYEFQMADAGEGALDLSPSARTPIVQEFDGLDSTAVDLQHVLSGTPAGTRVLFTVAVHSGPKKDFRMASFDVGDPPAGFPILLYCPSNIPPQNRIDVCFVPDVDYDGDFARYAVDLDGLVKNGYFQSNGIRDRREMWTFFTTHAEGNKTSSPVLIPAEVAENTAFDVIGLVHLDGMRDGAAGNVFTTEARSIGTAVHETGHAVFSLRDEYCSAGRQSCSTCRLDHCNRFASAADCEAFNRSHRFPAECRECAGDRTPCFFPEPDSLNCLMLRIRNDSIPDFSRTCIQRVKLVHQLFLDIR